MSRVAVTLNGETAEAEDGLSLRGLLEHLGVDPRRVVVEHNRAIVRGDEIDSHHVAAGDEIEILRLVGGGV